MPTQSAPLADSESPEHYTRDHYITSHYITGAPLVITDRLLNCNTALNNTYPAYVYKHSVADSKRLLSA